MANVTMLNDNEFDKKVLKSPRPVLVDFSATWCGPCQQFAPVLEEFAKENANINVYKIDIDENQETATKLGVMSVPTIILFKDGKEAIRNVGAINKNALKKMIQEA